MKTIVVDVGVCGDGLDGISGDLPAVQHLERLGLVWLALGGVLYSGGIYWFINDDKIKHGHGIWHVFVLLGSLAQFISIYFYVI